MCTWQGNDALLQLRAGSNHTAKGFKYDRGGGVTESGFQEAKSEWGNLSMQREGEGLGRSSQYRGITSTRQNDADESE